MTTATRTSANAYTALLLRYVAGDLEAQTLDSICQSIDDADATPAERLAYARFCLDALAAGDTDLVLPRPEEVADVLLIARA